MLNPLLPMSPGNVPRSIGRLWGLGQNAACLSVPPKFFEPPIRPESVMSFAVESSPRSITLYRTGAFWPEAFVTVISKPSTRVNVVLSKIFVFILPSLQNRREKFQEIFWQLLWGVRELWRPQNSQLSGRIRLTFVENDWQPKRLPNNVSL